MGSRMADSRSPRSGYRRTFTFFWSTSCAGRFYCVQSGRFLGGPLLRAPTEVSWCVQPADRSARSGDGATWPLRRHMDRPRWARWTTRNFFSSAPDNAGQFRSDPWRLSRSLLTTLTFSGDLMASRQITASIVPMANEPRRMAIIAVTSRRGGGCPASYWLMRIQPRAAPGTLVRNRVGVNFRGCSPKAL